MAVGNNIIFDPSKEELAVADVALAVSVTAGNSPSSSHAQSTDIPMDTPTEGRNLRLLSIRTIDPPSRLTPPGVANAANSAYGANANGQKKTHEAQATAEGEAVEGVWRAPRGGAKRMVLGALVQKVLERGGVVDEVLDALEGVDLG